MYFLVHRLFSKLRRRVAELRWEVLALLLAAHAATTWIGFLFAGEIDLLAPLTFAYFYATTATTVGYGDLSPATELGRMIAVIWLFPGSIAVFTAVLTKTISSVAGVWRRRMQGLGDYSNREGATVLVGYNATRTPRMIEELRLGARGRQDDEIIVMCKEAAPNLPDEIPYVRVEALSNREGLKRAGVAAADEVVIYADDDDETLAAALAVQAVAPETTHIVAHFNSEGAAELLKAPCPAIETVVSPSVELVVRAAQDPGASRLFSMLASSAHTDATIYSVATSGNQSVQTVREILRNAGATLIAIQGNDHSPSFVVDDAVELNPGDRLFYIAGGRIAGAVAGAI